MVPSGKCWPRSVSLYGATWPQWVKITSIPFLEYSGANQESHWQFYHHMNSCFANFAFKPVLVLCSLSAGPNNRNCGSHGIASLSLKTTQTLGLQSLMMMSQHGNTFHITGNLWGESTCEWGFTHQGPTAQSKYRKGPNTDCWFRREHV